MKRLLLTGMLCPLLAAAQEVKPLLSADYLALIGNDSLLSRKNKTVDSTNSINQSKLRFGGYYYNTMVVKNITVGADNILKLEPQYTEYLFIGGTATSRIEIRKRNRIPAIQNEYAQGRSANGILTWRGPETNELFSYGPALKLLEFDGSNYVYDINGKLVTGGSGNGIPANSYNNDIFRTASFLSNSVTLQAKYKKNYYQVLSAIIKAGQSSENTFITGNKNKANNFSVSAEANKKRFTVRSSYNYRQEKFTHNNRNGFLNRVYQQSLLSPVTFDSRQGNRLGVLQQRSYSAAGDNPLFLLDNADHSFLQQQHSGNFVVEQGFSKGKVRVSQSFENVQQRSNEGYQAGTAFFPNRVVINRNTRDANYYLQANAEYKLFRLGYPGTIESQLTGNYLYANNKSTINYLPIGRLYNYHRSSNDLSMGIYTTYRNNDFYSGLNLVNKIYSSNTAVNSNYFLPAVSFFSIFEDPFNLGRMSVKFAGGISRFNSELPIDKSFAANSLLQYSTANALQYLPVTEVNSFDNLRAIEHREYTALVELNYYNKLSLSIDWFNRKISNDIFPIAVAGELDLKNIAAHRNKGVEVELNLLPYLWGRNKVSVANTISLVKYRSKVTAINPGYNYLPIAGFSDVYKAIVINEPLGVIIGNSFLKDASGVVIIGADGFPLVNNTPSVIGNPVPDFIMKMSHRLNMKKWDFNVDWEWKKGGDICNGTAAMLDYYGRSLNSAQLRSTTNYVFNGVQVNGSHNNIPVSFYDPAKPFEQNRWVRYGAAGVAEAYIQKGDCLRLNNASVSYKPVIKKYLQQLSFTLSASNIILWSAYKGADSYQLLNDQPGTSGLDFFNLPSYQSFGFTVSLQF